MCLLEGSESSSSRGSNLNKTKGGEKKQRSTSTDDTNQPGKTILENEYIFNDLFQVQHARIGINQIKLLEMILNMEQAVVQKRTRVLNEGKKIIND